MKLAVRKPLERRVVWADPFASIDGVDLLCNDDAEMLVERENSVVISDDYACPFARLSGNGFVSLTFGL
jgi:hypothetical protein